MATLDVNPVINDFARTPSATSLVQPVYTTRLTPEQMAEESRIATAQGLRDVAAGRSLPLRKKRTRQII